MDFMYTRRMRKTLLLALVVVFGVLGLSCSGLKHLAKKPELSFAGLDVKSLALTGLTMNAKFSVKNPNSFDISVNKIVYGLKVNGRDFTAGEMNETISVEGDETKVVEVPFKVKYVDLIRTVKNFADKKATSFELTGLVKSGLFELPFNEKGNIDLAELSELSN